jgi:hypothetical protein
MQVQASHPLAIGAQQEHLGLLLVLAVVVQMQEGWELGVGGALLWGEGVA